MRARVETQGGLAGVGGGGRGLVGLAGDDLSPEGGVGREHAMEANEMEPGTRDESRQALQEFQRGHHQMGGSIAVRGFELQHNRAGPGAAQPFVAKGQARDVASRMKGNFLATWSRLYQLSPPGLVVNHLFRQVNLPA